MIDAKNLLETLVGNKGTPPPAQNPSEAASGLQGDPLGDLLKSLTPGGAPDSPQTATSGGPEGTPQTGTPGAQGDGGGDLGSLLNQLKEFAGREGGFPEILSQVFSQATSGVRQGADQLGQQTGFSENLRNTIQELSGKSPEELVNAIRELAAKNQLGTGAVLGGLGGLLLGTRTGRSAAGTAAKIGALALIAGLAYKAYQNYKDGRPLVGSEEESASVSPPPPGSGFEPEAVTDGETLNIIRAMVASAAVDGRVGPEEQAAITGSLQQTGMDAEAEEFLAAQLNNPPTIDEIVHSAQSERAASLVYTSARLAIDPDTPAEQEFLQQLATRLQIPPELAANIDAAARGMENRPVH